MFAKNLKKLFSSRHSKFAILGSGAGGVALSGKLATTKDIMRHDITLYDSSQFHYYKPGWTMVGSGLLSQSETKRPMRDIIPDGVNWVPENIAKITPEENSFTLNNGEVHTYDNLIISTGIHFNWAATKGLAEAIEDPNRPVASIYNEKSLSKILKMRDQDIKTALFTQPIDPISCGGAPQKICYTTMDYWKSQSKQPEVHLIQANMDIFPVPFYAQKLNQIADEYGIQRHHGNILTEVKADENVAVFKNLETGDIEEIEFDFLHAVPPMRGKPYLAGSGLANPLDLVEVDPFTLQHVDYDNIWSLGDGSNVPTSKTFSAVMDQVQTLYGNLVGSVLRGEGLTHKYDGYTGCPILVGGDKVLMAEFKYDAQIAPSFEKDQRVPRKLYYQLKKNIFPEVAFNWTRNGLWRGRKTIWDPSTNDYSEFQAEVEQEYLKERSA